MLSDFSSLAPKIKETVAASLKHGFRLETFRTSRRVAMPDRLHSRLSA